MPRIVKPPVANTQQVKKASAPSRVKQGVVKVTKTLLCRMANIASFAYKNTESDTSADTVAFIEKLQDEGHRLTFFNEKTEFSGVVARRGKEMIVSYHGTQSSKNIISDLKFFKRPVSFASGTVHSGFYNAFLDSKPILDGIFEEQVNQMLIDSSFDKPQLLSDIKTRMGKIDRGFYKQLIVNLKTQGHFKNPKQAKKLILDIMSKLQNLDDQDLNILLDQLKKNPQIDAYQNDPAMIIFREVVQYAGIKQAKLTFDGHSLGGAEATIAAFYYTKKYELNPENVEVFTFGSPRVFDPIMAKEYEALLGDKTYRVSEHHQDAITMVPLGIMSFKHVGKNIRLEKGKGDMMHLLAGYMDGIDKLGDEQEVQFDSRASWISSKFSPTFYLRLLILLPQMMLSVLSQKIYHAVKGQDSDLIK